MTQRRRFMYERGDHVCALCSSPADLLIAATDYIRIGLARGDRCLYLCRAEEIPAVRETLNGAGLHVEAEERRGALELVSYEVYRPDGRFDPDRMISRVRNALRDALAAGFAGLCAAGDMTWVLDDAPGTERLAEYEALMNHFFDEDRATGLCLYNHHALPAAVLDHALATHPIVGLDDRLLLTNPFYEDPELARGRVPEPATVLGKMASLNVPGLRARAAYPSWQ